jgi:hypothetical protein
MQEERYIIEEKIIETIPALYFKGNRYNIVFTDKRLIGDYLGGSGGAFAIGGAIGYVLAEKHIKKKSQESTTGEIPEEILTKHKKNFTLDYSTIEEAKLTKNALTLKLNQKLNKIGKKVVIGFHKKQRDEIEYIIMKVIPNITTIKY